MALKDYPEKLRPYVFHGININYTPGEKEATATCFLCNKEDHLFINAAEGTYHCQRCTESGNVYTFFQKIYEQSLTSDPSTTTILSDVKNLTQETLNNWGIVDSCITGDPLIPGFNTDGKLATLYRVFLQGDKWKVLVTPGTKRHPFGFNLYNPDTQSEVYLCEGPWDAMALYQAFKSYKKLRNGKIVRSKPGQGLLKDIAVIGLSGITHWTDDLAAALPPKITLAFDNDHPRRHGQKIIQPGWDGVQRIANLTSHADPPIKLYALNWGKSIEVPADSSPVTLTHNPDLPDGYDLSDLLTDYKTPVALLQVLAMRGLVQKPKSPSKSKGKSKSSKANQPTEPPPLIPLPRTSYKELVKDYDGHLHFPERLQDTLAVMLATVVSVQLEGIQVWLRIIGPPGSGKSTLAEAISADRDNIFPISHFTGLHSGFVEPGSNNADEDNSLIVKMHQRTTIVKDADTLLSNPQRNAILSEFRDVFDGTSRAHYRNKVTHEYEDIRTALILCGTDELRVLNRSALGERFLDLDILGSHSGESYVDRALRNTMSQVSRGFAQVDSLPSHPMPTDMDDLKRATMGYLHHLVANLSNTPMPTVSDKASLKIKALAGFVSLVRTKAHGGKGEDPTHRIRPELPTRISAQFKKLALCLAYTLNRKAVDKKVLNILQAIALDTAEGYQLEIVHELYKNWRTGMNADEVAETLRLSKSLMLRYLENMRQIGMVEMLAMSNGHPSGRKYYQWKLTKPFRQQYKLALKS